MRCIIRTPIETGTYLYYEKYFTLGRASISPRQAPPGARLEEYGPLIHNRGISSGPTHDTIPIEACDKNISIGFETTRRITGMLKGVLMKSCTDIPRRLAILCT